MRLLRLDLLRYGHLADVSLEFPRGARLCVVQGANEAGKSTALAAIADALFGFGHLTSFGFQHGPPNLRVGLRVAGPDGTELALVRRKGRRDTLLGSDDAPLPDDTLAHLLGSVTRTSFESGFGLDGRRLREGSLSLLRSGGEIGEAMLTGSGVGNLRAALETLEAQANALAGNHATSRLKLATKAWAAASQDVEARSVEPRDWQLADRSLRDTTAALARLQDESRIIATEESRLQRVRLVAPILARLARARGTADELSKTPVLPPDAQMRRQAARDARREAARDVEREAAEAAQTAALAAGLALDPGIHAMQDAVDALMARRGVAVQAQAELPELRTATSRHRADVTEVLSGMGVRTAPEAVDVPPAAWRQQAQAAVRRRAVLDANAEAAHQALLAAERRRDHARAELAARPAPASPALLRRTLEEIRGEGRLDAAWERAERALRFASAEAATAFARLPLWLHDAAALIACRLPLPGDETALARRLADAESDLMDAGRLLAESEAETARLDDVMVRLTREGTVPTPEAVAEARLRRDRIWRMIRRRLGGEATALDEADLLPLDLPVAFESLRDEADDLADRRADEATRVAEFLDARARSAASRELCAAHGEARSRARAGLDQAERQWKAIWAPAAVDPGTPAAMTEWRAARAEILKLVAVEAEARAEFDAIGSRVAGARGALAGVLSQGPQASLPELLRRAEAECEAAEAETLAHVMRVRALEREEADLPALRLAVEAAAAALETWRTGWRELAGRLGLRADISMPEADAAVNGWARIAEVSRAWADKRQRLAELEREVADFSAEAERLRAALDAAIEPAPVLAITLARRLARGRAAVAEHATLCERVARHERETRLAATRQADADAELAELRLLANADDDAGLERVIDEAKRRDAALEDLAERELELLAHGDGLLEHALRAEAEAVDRDTLVGRIDELRAEAAGLGERREALSAERARAETALVSMAEGRDAAGKAQEAEDALAEARAATERYAVVHVARVLLRAGIERFRAEQQGPLLRAAGAHFSRLTGGRYTSLVEGEDEAGRDVLKASAADGKACPIEALSEGTRDQLYLALRVAAVERRVSRSEKLPFIADDLLAQFDDRRAEAAIGLLTELGHATQVILFTHHAHIAELAAGQPGVAVLRLPALT